MRQLTLTLLSLIALMATLFAAGPRQALACSCAGIQPTEQFAQQVVQYSDLLVVGEVVSDGIVTGGVPTPLGATAVPGAPAPEAGALRYGTIRATIAVEQSYGSLAPRELEIITDDGGGGCGYGATLRQGGRHFLALRENEGSGTYNASYCTSFPFRLVEGPGAEKQSQEFMEILSEIAPPVDVERGGAPWWLIAAYAAGSLALLASVAVLKRRSDE
jgi:hypothetical protein